MVNWEPRARKVLSGESGALVPSRLCITLDKLPNFSGPLSCDVKERGSGEGSNRGQRYLRI